jgi:hypothetical protein
MKVRTAKPVRQTRFEIVLTIEQFSRLAASFTFASLQTAIKPDTVVVFNYQ